MNKSFTAEDCYTIKPNDVIRILRRENKAKADIKLSDVDCWLDNPDNPDVLCVSVKGHEPQKIVLEWVDISFGQMAYFRCDCGYRSSKLYLPPNGTQYQCRRCHKLRYRISSLNPTSIAGKALHRFNRINKLIETRANISHLFYNGRYTRRFENFLKHCKKEGLDNIVEDAQKLLEVVKTQQI